MVTTTRKDGQCGAILSKDGRWFFDAKMIESGQWFVLR